MDSISCMTRVTFFDHDYVPPAGLTYSVIAANHGGKWVFVRHRGRTTWEIPGGHIEQGETPDDAAVRELAEETGARDFSIVCVATYAVEKDGETGYGRLFYAAVGDMGPVNDTCEIEEVILSANLPSMLTYPDIQPHLHRRVVEYLPGG